MLRRIATVNCNSSQPNTDTDEQQQVTISMYPCLKEFGMVENQTVL